jgi:hypothetical protein
MTCCSPRERKTNANSSGGAKTIIVMHLAVHFSFVISLHGERERRLGVRLSGRVHRIGDLRTDGTGISHSNNSLQYSSLKYHKMRAFRLIRYLALSSIEVVG